jgi:hypothetical protein
MPRHASQKAVGPELMALAGVSLADATWYYRTRGGSEDAARLGKIRDQVAAFLAR